MKKIICLILFPIFLKAQIVNVTGGGSSGTPLQSYTDLSSAIAGAYSGDVFTLTNESVKGTFIKYTGSESVDSCIVLQNLSGVKYKRVIGLGENINPTWFGVTMGVQTGSYASKKATWRTNWRLFKKCLTYSIANDRTVEISGTLEIYPTNNYTVIGAKILRLIGTNNGFLDVKPEVRSSFYNVLFTFSTEGASINIQDLNVDGYKNGWAMETYPVNLRNSGNANQLRINNYATIRRGFWAGLTVGDFIAFQNTNGTGYTQTTVTALDSVNRTINITATMSVTDTGYCYTYFKDYTPIDSVYNYDSNVEITPEGTGFVSLIDFNVGQGNYSKDAPPIILKNINCTNFAGLINKSGGRNDVFIDQCKINASGVAISMFPGFNPNPSRLTITNTDFIDCSTLSTGNAVVDPIYGHDMYLHPNVPCFFSNNKHIRSKGSPITMTSDSGYKPASNFSKCELKNTLFQTCGEAVRLGSSSTWEVTNCKFQNATLQIGNSTSFKDCEFDREIGPVGQNQPYSGDSSYYKISFDNCIFYDSSGVTAGWAGSSRTKKTELFMSNCTKFLGGLGGPTFITSQSDGNLKVFLTDITVKRTNKSLYVNPFIHPNLNDSIYIDNVNYFISYSASTYGAFVQDQFYGNWFMSIRNSKINVPRFSIHDNGGFTTSKILISKSNIFCKDVSGEYPTIVSFKEGITTGTITSNTLTVTPDYDTYVIKDSLAVIKKIGISNFFQYPQGVAIKLVVQKPFKLIRYNSSTQTGSNLSLTADTISISSGQTITLTGSRYFTGLTQYRDSLTLGTGNGVLTSFNTGITTSLSSYRRIPFTCTVKAGSIIGTDNGNGVISGTGISEGWVGYSHNVCSVTFTTPPTTGTLVKLYYNRYTTHHQDQMWTLK